MSPLRVAVVGAGPMGRLHARAIHRREESAGDCELVMIADRHAARGQALASEFGGRASTKMPEAGDGIDAVVLAVPTRQHLVVGRELIARGFDVLIEKPLAASVEEARTLARLADEAGRILQVGHVEWYNPTWRAAVAEAGWPRRIEVDRMNPPVDRGLDMDVVQDFMLHDLDWVSRLVGEEIVTVEAEGRPVINTTLDVAWARLRFASGIEAELRVSRTHDQRRRRVRIEGAKGKVEADLLSGQLGPLEAVAQEEGSTPEELIEPLDSQWGDFMSACDSRAAPPNDGAVGVAAVELVERVRQVIAGDRAGGSSADDSTLRG